MRGGRGRRRHRDLRSAVGSDARGRRAGRVRRPSRAPVRRASTTPSPRSPTRSTSNRRRSPTVCAGSAPTSPAWSAPRRTASRLPARPPAGPPPSDPVAVWRFDAVGQALEVACHDERMAEALAPLLAAHPPSGDAPIHRFDVWDDDGFVITQDGQLFSDRGSLHDAVADVLTAITAVTMFGSRSTLLTHAAAVAGRDGVIVLGGGSNQGKSSTTVELMEQGFGYVTDEIVSLDPGGGWVSGLARPIGLEGPMRDARPHLRPPWLDRRRRRTALAGGARPPRPGRRGRPDAAVRRPRVRRRRTDARGAVGRAGRDRRRRRADLQPTRDHRGDDWAPWPSCSAARAPSACSTAGRNGRPRPCATSTTGCSPVPWTDEQVDRWVAELAAIDFTTPTQLACPVPQDTFDRLLQRVAGEQLEGLLVHAVETGAVAAGRRLRGPRRRAAQRRHGAGAAAGAGRPGGERGAGGCRRSSRAAEGRRPGDGRVRRPQPAAVRRRRPAARAGAVRRRHRRPASCRRGPLAPRGAARVRPPVRQGRARAVRRRRHRPPPHPDRRPVSDGGSRSASSSSGDAT